VKRVLITGAAGFVGANLAARCAADGADVHAIVRPGGDRWRLAPIADDVSTIDVDLRDAAAVRTAVVRIRPDWVFHTAAYGAYSWQTDADRIFETNLTGTIHLLDACAAAGIEAFVHSGTSSEYGYKDGAAAETDRPEPRSRYAVSKLCATEYCGFFARSLQLPVTTLRLYSVFGPLEDPCRLMPMIAVRGLAGEWPPLARADAAHDFIYIDDVCEAFVRVAGQPHPGAVYNVGTGIQTTLADVVREAQARLAIAADPPWQSMPSREWDTSVWVADPRRVAAAAGWRAATTFADGFDRLVAWLEKSPAMLDYYRRRQASPPAPRG
jgi:UDP-glucose 4-epimerase